MSKKKKIITTITITIVVLAFILGLCVPNFIMYKAKNAGANEEQIASFIKEKNPKKWYHTLTHTPNKNDNILKEEIDINKYVPVLLLVYRFECPDCENAYDQLQEEISKLSEKEKAHVYWVPSRTKIGATIVANYPVKAVPSSIILYKGNAETTLLYDMNTGDIYTDKIKEVFKQYKEYYNEE